MNTLKTKNFGQFKFQWLITLTLMWMVGTKNRRFTSLSIFNRKKYNLNDRYIGDNPLNFCPKFKCPKFLLFNVCYYILFLYSILEESTECGFTRFEIG